MNRVAILLDEGFEEIEALATVDILRRGMLAVDIIGVNKSVVTGAHGIGIQADKILSQFKETEYTGLILPGGMPGAKNLRANEEVLQLVRQFYTSKKLLAAICAAPTILDKAGILGDKQYTCYPTNQKEIQTGHYTGAVLEVDQQIITSKGAGTTFEFSYAILEYFGCDTLPLRENMMYQEVLDAHHLKK